MITKKRLLKLSAFTLMEVMIIFIIIGIFALFSTHSFEKYFEKQKELNARTNLQLIYAAAKMYKAKHGVNCAATTIIGEINTCLGLSLNEDDWDFEITALDGATDLRATATRELKDLTIITTGSIACVSSNPDNPCYY